MSSAAEAASSISSLMKSESAWLSTRRMRVGGHCSGLTWEQRSGLYCIDDDGTRGLLLTTQRSTRTVNRMKVFKERGMRCSQIANAKEAC